MCSIGVSLSERETHTDQINNSICNLCHGMTTGKHPWFPNGMPIPVAHMLTPSTSKAISIIPTEGTTWQLPFQQGLYWLGYGWSSALLNCLILWNLCNIASYLKDRLVEQITLLNSSILVTIRLGHSGTSQYWHHNLWSKVHLHWNRLCWGSNHWSPVWAVVRNNPHRGLSHRHLWLSYQFKHECCIWMERKSAVFTESRKAFCQCTLLFFCSFFQFPLGKQSIQHVSGFRRTYTLSHQGRTQNNFNVILKFSEILPRFCVPYFRVDIPR